LTAAVYRNARHERQLAQLAYALAELTEALARLGEIVRMQGALIAALTPRDMPALPTVPNRAFGMGH